MQKQRPDTSKLDSPTPHYKLWQFLVVCSAVDRKQKIKMEKFNSESTLVSPFCHKSVKTIKNKKSQKPS